MKSLLKLLFVILVNLTTLTALFLPARVSAAPDAALPDFDRFVKSVVDGQAGVVRGVYVPGVLALPVQQQPAGKPGYVSSKESVATQFQRAADFGVTGLLAHNYLAGRSFFNLANGQEVRVVYGDGVVKVYWVAAMYRYQALQPDSPTSDFVDLDTKGALSAKNLFDKVYYRGDHVTFQTCIKKDGLSTWGRLFIVATPAK